MILSEALYLPSVNFSRVSSEKNILTESPSINFSLPSAFLLLRVIFFFLSILYIKLLLAAERYFARYLSSLWLLPSLSIINSFILISILAHAVCISKASAAILKTHIQCAVFYIFHSVCFIFISCIKVCCKAGNSF